MKFNQILSWVVPDRFPINLKVKFECYHIKQIARDRWRSCITQGAGRQVHVFGKENHFLSGTLGWQLYYMQGVLTV